MYFFVKASPILHKIFGYKSLIGETHIHNTGGMAFGSS